MSKRLKTYRRSKRSFATARAAWADIGRQTGISARAVKGKAHTARSWVFHVR